MLANIADRFASSRPLRHLLFLGAAFLAIVIGGYYFGTFDQVIHIPFLKKYIDPLIYPGDPFLDLRFVHFSYFWFFFEPFYRWGLLEPVLFVVHFLVTYATFWMFWELSDTLFKNPLANLICVVTFIFPHIGVSGFQVIEFSLLNRTFVLPFLLGAFILYLKRRYLLAFLTLGVMYNIHALSVNFVLGMILLDAVLRIRQVGWKNLIGGILLFILAGFPVLYWRTGYSPIDLTLRPEMLSIVSRGLMVAIYDLFSNQPVIWLNTLGGLASLALFIIAVRQKPSPSHDRTITNFIITICFVFLIQVIVTNWYPVTFILQLQILRIGFFLLIFSYVYFANFLAQLYLKGRVNASAWILYTFTFSTFISPLLPLAAWISRKWYIVSHRRFTSITAAVVIINVSMISAGVFSGLWSPGFHIYGPKSDWVDTQKWAKANTPTDALFITPPQIFLHYIPDWRVFSDRSTVVTLAELIEVPFSPNFLPVWEQRFEDLAPGAIAKFNGNYFASGEITAEAYYSLSSSQLLAIARKYNATYLVVEKPHIHPFPVVYENQQFIIYHLAAILAHP